MRKFLLVLVGLVCLAFFTTPSAQAQCGSGYG